MRNDNGIVQQFRDVLVELDELKQAQLVGTNQIVAKPYASADAYDLEFTLLAPFQAPPSAFKAIKITVTPTNFLGNNILLSDVIPELKYTNGVRVTNWDTTTDTVNLDTYYFMVLIDSADDEKNTYLLGIIAPEDTVMRLKVHIVANSDLTFEIEELN